MKTWKTLRWIFIFHIFQYDRSVAPFSASVIVIGQPEIYLHQQQLVFQLQCGTLH